WTGARNQTPDDVFRDSTGAVQPFFPIRDGILAFEGAGAGAYLTFTGTTGARPEDAVIGTTRWIAGPVYDNTIPFVCEIPMPAGSPTVQVLSGEAPSLIRSAPRVALVRERLTERSRQLLSSIESFPSLAGGEFEMMNVADGGDGGAEQFELVVTYDSAVDPLNRRVVLWVEDAGPSFSFGPWHTHGDREPGSGSEAMRVAALADRVLRDEVVLAVGVGARAATASLLDGEGDGRVELGADVELHSFGGSADASGAAGLFDLRFGRAPHGG
ncbi:MAG: hypothetical protein AAF658_12120, partial [Myxococcota bacterium]